MPTLVHDSSTRSGSGRPAPMSPAPPREGAGRTASPSAPQEVVVRVVGETEARQGPPKRARSGFSVRGFLASILLGAVAIGLFLVAGAITGLFHFGNPFSATTVDRTPPALLKQLSNLAEYHAAQGTFQVRVDVENDVGLVPSFIAGERTLFNATGTVDATVDFSRLGTDAVRVDGDRVAIVLDQPAYGKAVVDPARSSVVDRDRGIVDRIGDLFGDDTNNEKGLYELAGTKIAAAAKESNLQARAEKNTRRMLEGLLGRLGFTDVRVTFVQPSTSTHGSSGR
jgi:hypothetical protein